MTQQSAQEVSAADFCGLANEQQDTHLARGNSCRNGWIRILATHQQGVKVSVEQIRHVVWEWI